MIVIFASDFDIKIRAKVVGFNVNSFKTTDKLVLLYKGEEPEIIHIAKGNPFEVTVMTDDGKTKLYSGRSEVEKSIVNIRELS